MFINLSLKNNFFETIITLVVSWIWQITHKPLYIRKRFLIHMLASLWATTHSCSAQSETLGNFLVETSASIYFTHLKVHMPAMWRSSKDADSWQNTDQASTAEVQIQTQCERSFLYCGSRRFYAPSFTKIYIAQLKDSSFSKWWTVLIKTKIWQLGGKWLLREGTCHKATKGWLKDSYLVKIICNEHIEHIEHIVVSQKTQKSRTNGCQFPRGPLHISPPGHS